MKYSIFFILISTISFSQVKLLSWNLENFGKSKTYSTLTYIANTLKEYDIVAIQEVVAGNGGAQAVAKLADELNRIGTKWDYSISDPTTSSAYKTERYAFLWKTAKVKKIGKEIQPRNRSRTLFLHLRIQFQTIHNCQFSRNHQKQTARNRNKILQIFTR